MEREREERSEVFRWLARSWGLEAKDGLMIYASLDNPLMRTMKKGIDRRAEEDERLFII